MAFPSQFPRTLAAAAAALFLAGCGAPPAARPEPETATESHGAQRRDRVTESVASLSGDDLDGQRVARVEELIAGRVAGVRVMRLPDGGFTVRIRGAGGFGDGEPLWVVDGMPIRILRPGSALDGIPPSHIARIDILKDAASSAVYGSQGANGVVLVTTRRP
jgi:TonB-dependent SusC/RagA subfamily outer membrane receptor